MTNYSVISDSVVVDANLAVRAILPVVGKPNDLPRFSAWHQARVDVLAPDTLLPEAVSVIRREIFDRRITEFEASLVIEDLFRLGIEIIPSNKTICQSALVWAGRLGQSKAYDGFYLAVAERAKSELWTADERLFNRSQQLGLAWVRWAGEGKA